MQNKMTLLPLESKFLKLVPMNVLSFLFHIYSKISKLPLKNQVLFTNSKWCIDIFTMVLFVIIGWWRGFIGFSIFNA